MNFVGAARLRQGFVGAIFCAGAKNGVEYLRLSKRSKIGALWDRASFLHPVLRKFINIPQLPESFQVPVALMYFVKLLASADDRLLNHDTLLFDSSSISDVGLSLHGLFCTAISTRITGNFST